MPNENEIKAIFSLLQTESKHHKQLTDSLVKFYLQDPKLVYNLALEYFGVLPPFLIELFKKNQSGLTELSVYLKRKNPSLLEGLVLLAKIINPKADKQEILTLFNFAREEFDKVIDSSFEISQKAQVLKNFFFDTMGFKTEPLAKNTALLNLPEVFTNLKTTPFMLAAIYLIFIYPYEVKSAVFEAENKVLVRLQDAFSLETLYIDITQKGGFVSEEDCYIYAADNSIKWNPQNIVPLNNTAIFKHLLSDLISTSKDYGFLCAYLD